LLVFVAPHVHILPQSKLLLKLMVSVKRLKWENRRIHVSKSVTVVTSFLFVILIFMLANLREQQMDLYHAALKNNVKKNDWISQEDILQDKKQHSGGDQTTYDPNYQPRGILDYPISLLRNITEPIHPTDVIFYWHIPKAAGTSIKSLFTTCYKLARADQYPDRAESYSFIHNVYNVDTSTLPGIARAKKKGLIQRDVIDVVASSYLHEGAALFTDEHHGRVFVMMRHPVDVAVSLFHYPASAVWERTYKEEWQNMTLMEYALSTDPELRIDNWMTRYLSRNIHNEITKDDIRLAKDIIRFKCLIGMVDEFEDSMNMFQSFFGLNVIDSDCVHNFISHNKLNSNKHGLIDPKSAEYKVIAKNSAIDIELYEFARNQYQLQDEKLLKNRKSWNYRQNWH
jgi:hypothetical protein